MTAVFGGFVLPAVTVLLLAGCGSGRAESAGSAAESFTRAWAAGDGATVCAQLSPAAREGVVSATGGRCADGVLSEDLPSPGPAEQVEVWGEAAQVRTASDVLFLSHYDHGWKVTAAGCTPRPGEPYDCALQGG